MREPVNSISVPGCGVGSECICPRMGKQRKDVATHSQPYPCGSSCVPNYGSGIFRSEKVPLHSIPDLSTTSNICVLPLLQEKLLQIVCSCFSVRSKPTSERDAVHGHDCSSLHTHLLVGGRSVRRCRFPGC